MAKAIPKPVKPVITEKQKKMNDLVNTINKKYGANVIGKGSDAHIIEKLTRRYIVCPSKELTRSLNCAGFAGIVELYGLNSSGKTKMAIETIRENQKREPEFMSVWFETEGSIDKSDLEDAGVDLTRVLYFSQDDVGTAERSMDVLRDLIMDGQIDLYVINSIAGLCPKVEQEDDIEKANVAPVARLLSKFFRNIVGALNKSKSTMIVINQMRTNIGNKYGDPNISTGGLALGFFASQRIKMNKLKIGANEPIKAEEGVKISCYVHKNRFAGTMNPFTNCEYYARFGTGIDSTCNLPELLSECGIMRRAGAYWYHEDKNGVPIMYDGEEVKFKKKEDFLNKLYTDATFKEYLSELLSQVEARSSTDEEIANIENENKMIQSSLITLVPEMDNVIETEG